MSSPTHPVNEDRGALSHDIAPRALEPSAESDVRDLCCYLGVTPESFAKKQDRYLAGLSELLTFHEVIGPADRVDASSFRAAVKEFQRAAGLTVDGLPGEETLWELNYVWALAHRVELVELTMDEPAPAGREHVDDEHRVRSIQVRSDVAAAIAGLRDDLHAAGAPLTSSGALRKLTGARPTARSTTSIHHCAAAFDLATTMGMITQGPVRPEDQPYVITTDSGRWRVWAKALSGSELTLDAVTWAYGATKTRRTTGRFLDVTATAAARGLRGIRPGSTFPDDYLAAEWWHLQASDVLVPWVSQFGSEVLRLRANAESAFQAQPAMWTMRKRIFGRAINGWH